MTVLLDTNALLWAVLHPSSLSPKATEILSDESNQALVSAASAWEIATKARLRKLPGAEAFESNLLDVLEFNGYSILPIDGATALHAARLVSAHTDPFDRIIAAQALALDIPVISIDSKLDNFGIRRIW